MVLFDQFIEKLQAGDESALELMNFLYKEREITIIRELYGIGCHKHDENEIGEVLGLTAERVDIIHKKCLAKFDAFAKEFPSVSKK